MSSWEVTLPGSGGTSDVTAPLLLLRSRPVEPTVNPNVSWACATVLVVAILAGLFVLCWHGTLSGAAVLPVVASIASAAVAVFGVGHGVKIGARAALKKPPETR